MNKTYPYSHQSRMKREQTDSALKAEPDERRHRQQYDHSASICQCIRPRSRLRLRSQLLPFRRRSGVVDLHLQRPG